MNKRIVSVQDISCFGQCSLTVALPVLSSLGIETAVVPTAVLSTHTGKFENYTFHDLSEEIPAIKNHWEKYNITFDAVYSGYLGSCKQIRYVLDLFDSVRKDNSKLFIDPVMGDNGKFYSGFDENFAQLMRNYCQFADVITPNITEAQILLGSYDFKDFYSMDEITQITGELAFNSKQMVIVTGIPFDEDTIVVSTFDADKNDMKIIRQQNIKGRYHGTGDLFASVCFGLLLKDYDLFTSASVASDFVLSAIKNTPDSDTHWYGVHFEECLKELGKFV
jgi:pyridoxine kinase